jgi:hypothetical protein
MNKKVCDEMMDAFFSLDKDEHYPLKLTLHLLACETCRTQVRLCTLAEKVSAAPLLRPADDDAVQALMAKIIEAFPDHKEIGPISFRRWIVSGVVMILAMMLFAVVSPQSSGDYLQLAFYLVFGGVVTAYCALFIASNMDFFVKKIETMQQPIV